MNTTRRDVEDTIKENREECMLMKGGGDFSRRKGRAKEEQKKVAVKIWDNQELEEDRRLDKARFEEQEVEKMAVELKEGAKETGKKNECWEKESEQLKKKAVKALREWTRTKINRNSFVEAKGREKTEKKNGGR
ncbi:hypothetical protein GEV33_005884 [Tenebrio molitor]|uniref:Uncharacterized protein n=1 Tax=Tenebrio molitor TaxID=7067 RepID=A0A8J6LL42_TENMO|nr:hypothetical protein GEV33_005884 [Tenebrio molitor]